MISEFMLDSISFVYVRQLKCHVDNFVISIWKYQRQKLKMKLKDVAYGYLYFLDGIL